MAIDDKKLKNKKAGGKPTPDVIDMLEAITSPETVQYGNPLEVAQLEIENDELRATLKNAIAQIDKKAFRFRNFILTKTGLQIDGEITEDDANELGRVLKKFADRLQFLMGDWANLYLDVNMSDEERGGVYTALSEQFEIEKKTLRNYANVCRIIDVSSRKDGLSFSHHAYVAWLPQSLKGREAEFLNAAVENGWGVRELNQHIKEAAAKLLPASNAPDLIIDIKIPVRQFRDVLKLMGTDVSKLKDKKRNEHLGQIATLRQLLDEVEAQLKD